MYNFNLPRYPTRRVKKLKNCSIIVILADSWKQYQYMKVELLKFPSEVFLSCSLDLNHNFDLLQSDTLLQQGKIPFSRLVIYLNFLREICSQL